MRNRFAFRILIFITLIGGFLRFYNLLWGDEFYFHPDERNMAISISQMRVEENLHPHFFAYGQFPLYLAYFSYQGTHFIKNLWNSPLISQFLPPALLRKAMQAGNYSITPIPFRDSVFWLRFWSAFASTLTMPVVYLTMKELINSNHKALNLINPKCDVGSEKCDTDTLKSRSGKWEENISLQENQDFKTSTSKNSHISHLTSELGVEVPSLLAALLAAFIPGLIQAAHFGTTESLLTFFFMIIIYLSLKFFKTESLKYLLFAGIASGIAMGTKLSAVFFIFAPITTIALISKKRAGSIFKKATAFILYVILYSSFSILFFSLASPYNLLASKDFIGTSTYETSVAQGKVSVFYTDQFEKTIPIFYQLTRIFPYVLGWPILIIGTLGFLYISLQLMIKFF